MKRHELEHLLRAAGSIANRDEFIVLGSQAILASHPDAPQAVLASMEADFCAPNDPESTQVVEGSIGELSPFHDTFGYYVHGMELEGVILADGWRDRLVDLKSHHTGGVVGRCLHPIDIAISKLAAGREKDLDYVATIIDAGIVSATMLRPLFASFAPELKKQLEERLARLIS